LHEKVGGVSLASSVFRSIPRSTPLSFYCRGSKGFHPSFGLRCHPGAGRPLAGVDPFILSYKDRVILFSFEQDYFFFIFYTCVRVWCAKQCGLCRLQESRPDGRSFIHPSTLPTPLFPRTRCTSFQFFPGRLPL